VQEFVIASDNTAMLIKPVIFFTVTIIGLKNKGSCRKISSLKPRNKRKVNLFYDITQVAKFSTWQISIIGSEINLNDPSIRDQVFHILECTGPARK
jgi:hypothetical protein